MKNLYALLFAMAITLAANSQVLDGSSCSQAKEIPTIPDSCAVNEHQLNAGDYEQWHHVKPAQPEMHFKIEPPQTQPEAHIHKATLIKGGCGGGTVVEKKDIALGEILEITRTDLTVNDDYYIKIERDSSCAQCNSQGGAFYGLCVEKEIPCNLTADAGNDTVIFAGQSVQIGSTPVSGNTYSWSPATGLSGTNISNPIASPAASTTYTLTVTDVNGCSATDDVQITVTTDTIPKLEASQCGATNISLTEMLASIPIAGATQYEFLIENDSAGLSEAIISVDRFFQLTEFNGPIEYERTYRIKVRVLISGSYSEYGDVCTITIGEKGPFCGFDNILKEAKANDATLQQSLDNLENDVLNFVNSNPLIAHKTIPVVVHVMGTGNLDISYDQIKWQIAALNAAYAANYPNYNQQTHGQYALNTQIQFCLATITTGTDGFGNPLQWTYTYEPGVMRYGSTDPLVLDPSSSDPNQTALKNITHPSGQGRFPFSMYLNIWLVRNINGTSVVIGFGFIPTGNPNPTFDGIVMRADAFGDNTPGNSFNLPAVEQGKILAHEAGHYLGLYHTFGTSNPNDPPACYGTTSADCSTSGDRVCDTPPTSCGLNNCNGTNCNTNTCFETYFTQPFTDHVDMFENYLCYSHDVCMNTFTTGQTNRMHGFLVSDPGRNILWQTTNLAATGAGGQSGCTACLIQANILYAPSAPCPGAPINFFTPSGQGLCATSWLWDFGDGTTSNVQNPTHAYSSSGTYNVTLTATGSGQTIDQTVTIEVAPPTATISPVGFLETSTTVCSGTEASVQIVFTGTPPFNITISNQNINFSFSNITSNEVILPITVLNQNATFTLTNFSDAYCTGTPSGSVTFNVVSCCDNLVDCNGDFETPDPPVCPPVCFESDHGCKTNQFAAPGQGKFVITTTGNINGNSWDGTNHTPNGKYFMVCDSDPDNAKDIWRGEISSVAMNNQYVFSVYLNNLIRVGLGYPFPRIVLLINGTPITPELNIPEYPDVWTPLNILWKAPANISPCTLSIRSAVPQGNGRDLGIDDVSFRPVSDISATISTTANANCIINSATVTATGGTPGYTYLWSNGAASASLSGLAAGNYFVTVTDASGCETVAGVTLNSGASVVIEGELTFCQGDNSILTASNGFNNYSWTGPGGFTANTQSITVTIAGTYSVTASNTGCQASNSVDVTVTPVPNVSVTPASPTITCSNPVTLTASGASFYSWAPATGLNTTGGSVVTASPTSNTTYTVTGTTAGCPSDQATVTVTVNPIQISITPSSPTICPGGSPATLTASGATTYTWSPATGLSSTSGATVTASPTATTTYTVTGTNTNGCTVIAGNVTVTVAIPPPPVIIGNNNNCKQAGSGFITYSVQNPVSGSTYTWSVTNGTIISASSTSATVNWGNIISTSTITLTVTDVNGCANTNTLTVFPCCYYSQGGSNVPLYNETSLSGTTKYSFGSLTNNITINGTYTIASGSTVVFENIPVFLGPDAKIVIQNNAALICSTTFTNQSDPETILSAGCGIMWDGIYLESNTSSLIITSASQTNRTTVMDAKNAVVCKNGGTYSITKSVLLNNLKCIVQENNATEIITGNNFQTNAGDLKPYYIGNAQSTAQIGKSFIELANVPGINIGATGAANRNSFIRADNGIIGINSSASIINNYFQYFNPAGFFTGNAVISIAGNSNTALVVGGNTASQNEFKNCLNGVAAFFKQNLSIKANKFTEARNGIYVTSFGSYAKTIDILGNIMNNFEYGISLLDVPVCTLKVNGNKLTQNNSSFATGAGIRVLNSLSFKGQQLLTPEIKNNTLLGSQGSYTGISALNVYNGQIRFNTLTLPQGNSIAANTTVYGIRVQGTFNAKVTDNTIKRLSTLPDPNAAVSANLYGISMENCFNARVGVNNLNRMGSGIRGFQNCANTKFYCNSLYKCYNGFFFLQASISTQGAANVTTDNTWVDLGVSGDNRILYNITNTNVNWYYKSSPTNNNPLVGAGVAQHLTTPLLNFSSTTGMSGCGDLQKKESATPEEREQLFGDIVRDERIFNEHEPEFKFAEREFAFRGLTEEAFLQLGAPDDALFQNYVDTTGLTNKGKLNEVRKAIELNDLALGENKNNSIVPNNIMEENRKQVNDIYLKTLAVDKTEFDVMQTTTLESIACQDALEGGEAVYSARVMLRMDGNCSSAKMAFVNEEENYDEKKMILQEIKSYSISKIYPNPANDKLMLDYQIKENENCWLIIHDLMGKSVIKEKLLWNKNHLEINAERLNNGVYFYETLIDGKPVIKDKLLIIK